VGDLRIVASDRLDTLVEVRPSDPAKEADVTAAGQAQVDYAGGRLSIKAGRSWKQYTPWGGGESIDVHVEVPTGSHIHGEAGVAGLRTAGRLGECRFRTGAGDILVEYAGPAHLRTGAGDITVDQVAGHAEITTGTGALHIGRIDGSASIKNSNGDTWAGEVTGDLRAKAANGRITVDRTLATVVAKSANGDIRLGGVARGEVVAETSLGKVDIGVLEGVAAWLELDTRFGRIRNELDPSARPAAGEQAVEIRAHTSMGDITVRRSSTNHVPHF
jgi:hypothetical protein